MRRMLDPKEVGGGEKLYKHTINVFSSTYGHVCITLYNYSGDAINSEGKLKTAITAIGEVSATGYFSNGGRIYNVYLIKVNNSNAVEANGYSITTDNTATRSSIVLDSSFRSYRDNTQQVN